jgi:hypothetical protein
MLKYGISLEQNHGPFAYRLEHLAEELTDGLQYIEWIKESGKIICLMFEMLVQDMENKDFCPLETPCTPENLKEGGCIACLKEHYEMKARDIAI